MRSNFQVNRLYTSSDTCITNVIAPRRVKRENVAFPVAVRRSKTPLLKLPILVARASVSFGHVVDETEGAARQRHFKTSSTGDENARFPSMTILRFEHYLLT